MNHQRLTTAGATAALAAVLTAVAGIPATADAASTTAESKATSKASPTVQVRRAKDITSLRMNDLHVASGACRNIKMVARHNMPHGYDVDVDFEVWHGNHYIDTGSVFTDHNGYVSGTYLWCAYFDGFGKLRAGPSSVDWYSDDFLHSGHFRDGTRGYFYVKMASKVRNYTAHRTGAKVTFRGTFTHYKNSASRWARWTHRPVLVQYRKHSGAWHNYGRRTHTDTNGVAAVTVMSAHHRTWRLLARGGGTVWGVGTAPVSR